MGQFDTLERNAVESKQPARARDPQIPVMRLRESERAAQGCPLTRAPGRVVQLLDGQIRTERASTVARDQCNEREPPTFSANDASFHGVILALEPLRCPCARKDTTGPAADQLQVVLADYNSARPLANESAPLRFGRRGKLTTYIATYH